MSNPVSRCGTIAIVGRPNVGKSTLLNSIIGQKLSITSRKPQTTWQQILGVITVNNTQMVFVDTPGWQFRPKGQINRLMNRHIISALDYVDVVVMVADAREWILNDDKVCALFGEIPCKRILVFNKHDRISDKKKMLPLIADVQARYKFDEILPASALQRDNIDVLTELIGVELPRRPHQFPDDQITPHSERFLVSELIREQLIRGLGEELPYTVSVVIETFRETNVATEIHAEIWVEREGQKGIVIGAKGNRLKSMASAARVDIENLLQRKVYLRTWVKTKNKWTDDLDALNRLDLNN